MGFSPPLAAIAIHRQVNAHRSPRRYLRKGIRRSISRSLDQFRDGASAFVDDRNGPTLRIDPMRVEVDTEVTECRGGKVLRSNLTTSDGATARVGTADDLTVRHAPAGGDH